jgi:hypothetical protein
MEVGLAVAVLAGGVAVLRGGSLQAIAATEFRRPWLLVGAVGLRLAFDLWDPAWLSSTGSLGVVVLTNFAMVGFLLVNRTLPGVLLVGAGLALNLIVIGANGAMPVSLDAGGMAESSRSLDQGIGHELMTPDTVLPWLGDVILLSPVGIIISFGDVVLAAGLARLSYCQAFTGRPSA